MVRAIAPEQRPLGRLMCKTSAEGVCRPPLKLTSLCKTQRGKGTVCPGPAQRTANRGMVQTFNDAPVRSEHRQYTRRLALAGGLTYPRYFQRFNGLFKKVIYVMSAIERNTRFISIRSSRAEEKPAG